MMWRKVRHPILTFKRWRLRRQHVVNSKVDLQASRKHRLPLEQCTVDQLQSALRHNEREALRYQQIVNGRPHKGNYDALATWHRMCQRPIKELIAELGKLGDGKRVEDIRWKRRRRPTEELMRIRRLG
jgi:hypothetical protein